MEIWAAISIGAVVLLLLIWTVSCQRRLAAMDENVNNAMAQVGVQLSSRFDALIALLELVNGYTSHELETLTETVRARRSPIVSGSTPGEVLDQEGVIADTLGRVSMVAQRYPELKASESYCKCMNAVESYENMVRTSRLIYNDSVTKLNRELHMFPASFIGRALSFRQREYLEEPEGKAGMPGMGRL